MKEVEKIVAVFADKQTGSLMRSDLEKLLTVNRARADVASESCCSDEVKDMFEKLQYGPNNLTFKVEDLSLKLARALGEYPDPGIPRNQKKPGS